MLEFLNPEDESDGSTRKGAERLANKIMEFWREHGADVMVSVHSLQSGPAMGRSHFGLKSTLVDGLPTKALFQEKDAA